jgi:hypothetical protein
MESLVEGPTLFSFCFHPVFTKCGIVVVMDREKEGNVHSENPGVVGDMMDSIDNT